jgi:hypothetical protein
MFNDVYLFLWLLQVRVYPNVRQGVPPVTRFGMLVVKAEILKQPQPRYNHAIELRFFHCGPQMVNQYRTYCVSCEARIALLKAAVNSIADTVIGCFGAVGQRFSSLSQVSPRVRVA